MKLALSLLVLVAASPAVALQPLEVFEAAAARHNPDSLESQASRDVASAQADAALGRVLPGISVRGTYTRNQFDSVFDLAPGVVVTVVPFNQYDGTAALTVPLFDAAGFERVAAARTLSRSAGDQLAATRLAVEAVVAQHYYQLVANLALAAASGKAQAVSQESLRLAQNRYHAGAAPELDLDRARADLEQQNQQVAAAGLQVELASRALDSASGVGPETAQSVALDDDLHPEAELASFETSIDAIPSVAAAAAGTRAADQQLAAQRLAMVPSLAGTIAEHGTSAPAFTGHTYAWQAVVALTWAVDLTTAANIREQRAASAAASARELRTRLAARDGIERQWETVAASIAKSRSARAGLAAANRAAASAHNQYAAGATTQLELLQAQRDAFAAEVARIQADADLVNARAQLRLAVGTSLLQSPGKTP